MNTTKSLVVTLLLMSFLAEVLPSNPDSELVQDSSSSNGHTWGKSAPMNLNKQPRSVLHDPKLELRYITFGERLPVYNKPYGFISQSRVLFRLGNNNNPDFKVPTDKGPRFSRYQDFTSNNAKIFSVITSRGSNAPFPEELPQRTEDVPLPQESPQKHLNDHLSNDRLQRSPTYPLSPELPQKPLDESIEQYSFREAEDEHFLQESPQKQSTDILEEDLFYRSPIDPLSSESPQMPPHESSVQDSPQRSEDEPLSQKSPQKHSNDFIPEDPPQRPPIDLSSSESPQTTLDESSAEDSPQGAIKFGTLNEDLSPESPPGNGNNGPHNPNRVTGPNVTRRSNSAVNFYPNMENTPVKPQFDQRPQLRNNRRPPFNSHPSYSTSQPQNNANCDLRNKVRTTPNPNLSSRKGYTGNAQSGRSRSSSCIDDKPRVVAETPIEQNPQIFPVNSVTNDYRRVSPDSNLYAEMINDFAFKLMEISKPPGVNFVISPLSIFIALSMCYLGSEGSTKSQLEDVLGLNENAVHNERLHEGLKTLVSLITPQSSTNQLFLANGAFFGKNYTANQKFADDIRIFYSAILKYLDFGNPRTSIPIINQWVSEKTNHMITSMADKPPDVSTKLLLLNAMYFKGIWKKQFSADLTYNGRFFNLEGRERTVPTMVLYNETFPFYRNEELKHSFLKLPYQGDDISMIIALPHAFEEKPMSDMTERILCRIRDGMRDTRMDRVTIPRFRFTYSQFLEKPLRELGIRDLFTPRLVNLSKMGYQRDLVVSAILHKAVIDVNEEGTTASAVTGVRLVPLTYRNTTDFVVNHPFAFYIVHEPTGLVLFYGKIVDTENAPSANSNRRQVSGNRG